LKSTERFSDRVTNYIKYRPSYPDEMVAFLVNVVRDSHKKRCADVASGTGILTKLLAPFFERIVGVEPNLEMRLAGEKVLSRFTNFRSLNGTAENTPIEPRSIDLVTVAQAFHWFDQQKFRSECLRILRDEGIVALIWNNRRLDTAFLEKYEELLRRYATDYNEVKQQNVTKDQLRIFFGGDFGTVEFPNKQQFDLEGLFGRHDSSSYAPREGSAEYLILRRELRSSFERYSENGKIDFNYTTKVYWAKMR
jgi:SAM-dependent methyltransferase